MSLPDAFLRRLARIVPPDAYDRVLASFAEPRAVGFRVNTLRASDPDAVVRELERRGLHPEPVAGLPLAYTVPPGERDALLGSGPCEEAKIYVQDLASQVVVHLLDPQPGEAVLDLCAAPGGKTAQIAALMRSRGELVAMDLARERFFRMRANLERQGADLVRTINRDGTTAWRHRPEHFDRVLVDAPCSSEGRFRRDEPETFRYWQPRKSKEMARKQQRLLYSAIQSARPGGVVVYSTCTFAPEENEAVVSRALKMFGEAVEIEALELPSFCRKQPPLAAWGGRRFEPAVGLTVRLLPTERSEAFFVARFRKKASTAP